MNKIYSILYHPNINRILRNVNYVLSPILPKKLKIHPSGTLKVRIKNYDAIKLTANQTSYVARELFWKGSDNYEYTPIFIKIIEKVDSFFDIGSSIGYYSILAAGINKNIRIEAFEPSVGGMTYLTQNVILNDFSSRINVNFLALSNNSGEIDFFEIRNNKYPNIYNLSGEHNVGTKPYLQADKTKVNALTLDEFVEEKKIANIDLIKIDTEGSEDLILNNSHKTIDKFKPIVICEVLFNKIESNLERLMSQHDYEFYNHEGRKLTRVHTLKRKADNGVRNCFFVHPTKRHLIKEFIK